MQSYTPTHLSAKTSLNQNMCRRTKIWTITKISYDENGRVRLDSRLVVLTLLDELLKAQIINVPTYNRAKQEILRDMKSNLKLP